MRGVMKVFNSKHLWVYLLVMSVYMGVYIALCVIEYYISKIPTIGSFLFYPYYGHSEIGYQAYIFPHMFALIASYRVIFFFKNINYGGIIITTAITIIIIGLINLLFPFRPEDDRFLSVLFILSGVIFWCLIDLVPTFKKIFVCGKEKEKDGKKQSDFAFQQKRSRASNKKKLLVKGMLEWCYCGFFLIIFLIIWLALWIVDLCGK